MSDRLTLGDLCHTKSSLRLPLTVYVAAGVKDVAQAQATPADEQIDSSKTNSQQDFSETSYTGSMDSINSFDGGVGGSGSGSGSGSATKITQNHSDSNSTHADGRTTATNQSSVSSNGSNEHAMKHDVNDASHTFSQYDGHGMDENVVINSSKLKSDLRTSANRQSDSTDEDSGIENIRIAKEI